MEKQQGVTLVGMVMACIVIVIVGIGGLKIAPAYIEYFKVKKAVVGIVQGGDARGGTVGDVRTAFDRRAAVDDIDVITARDLDITKEGNEVVISFAYQRKIPLFSNISLLIDFAGRSN
ncbi:MAG TPA: DUF4845 domain-containing protein [Burkholderiales bacterium]|nr:DUF4845 domain-containing protein [Burkholderiales bacterium]